MQSSEFSLSAVLEAVESLHEEEHSGKEAPFLDASPLRTMQHGLESLLFRGQLQGQEWIVAYVLYCLVDNVFYNMSGDVPASDEASKVQVEFLRRFVLHCRSIEESLKQQGPSKSVFSLSRLVEDFFATIQDLNQL